VTSRYYEQIKIMPAPRRTDGNYRTYEQPHLYRLRFIRRCRDLGFTLDHIRELLCLAAQAKQDCSAVDRITVNHLKEIERKRADLGRLAVELRRIKNRCPGKGPIANCRILEALSPAPRRTPGRADARPSAQVDERDSSGGKWRR
jgi:DNA-binding transcriptional MerR regulator